MGPGRPTLGSWVAYGLGSENQNLPAYVVLDDPLGLPVNGVENWQAGFLPPHLPGHALPLDRLAGAEPASPTSTGPPASRRRERDLLAPARRSCTSGSGPASRRSTPASPATNWPRACSSRRPTRSTSRRRPPATLELYGIGREPTDSYGRRCLIARRLVERGVRFVQLYINGQIWDNHTRPGDRPEGRLRPHRPADRRRCCAI